MWIWNFDEEQLEKTSHPDESFQLGDNSYVKVDSEIDHSKVMANLGLKVGRVFLVVKRNQVDFDKSTRKKLLNEGLLIDNIANLK